MDSPHFTTLDEWWKAFHRHPFYRNQPFSETWDREWNEFWIEYDRLNADRIKSGLEQLKWQDIEEGRRQAWKETRDQQATKWDDADWTVCSLGHRMQFYLYNNEVERVSDWASALQLWESCLETLNDPKRRDHLWKILSLTQQASYRLLKDWWNALYQPEELTLAAKKTIQAASLKVDVYTILHPHPQFDDVKVQSRAQESVYHSWMFLLFRREFFASEYCPNMTRLYHGKLFTIRTNAFAHAVTQMIAHSFAIDRVTTPTVVSTEIVQYPINYRGSREWLPAPNKVNDKPYYLWDIKNKKTVVTADLGSSFEYTCISHTWGRWRQGMEKVNGVPWFVPQNTLFDVHQLPDHFKSSPITTPYLWFDLFCIPQEDRPKPSKILGLFSKSKKQDPKYELTPFLKSKQVEEIGRQAGIFHCAAKSVIWFHDIESWDGAASVLEWFSANWLHNTNWPQIYDTKTWVDEARKTADVPAELMRPAKWDDPEKVANYGGSLGTLAELEEKVKNGQEPTFSKISGWFSSLWTLQEAALCPDLMLASRSWKLLCDGRGQPIPLNALAIFVSDHHSYGRYRIEPGTDLSDAEGFDHIYYNDPKYRVDEIHEKWPRGGVDLTNAINMSRLDFLYRQPSQGGLLILANIRQSSGSRAPAIMSALGITDWYRPDDASTGPDKKQNKEALIFGIYPLRFVQEAAIKIGPPFFFAQYSAKIRSTGFLLEPQAEEYGSMLPFGAPKGWYSSRITIKEQQSLARTDHPSVSTWIINVDGSVSIGSAGILASSRERSPKEIIVSINHFTQAYYKTCGLNEWLDSMPDEYDIWAISMYRDAAFHHGLILAGKKSQSPCSRLWRVGAFNTSENPTMSNSTIVNWTVV